MPWPVVCRPSVRPSKRMAIYWVGILNVHLSIVSPSLAFHIFDISSRTISWIELKQWEALWQHGDSELLKSFRSDIQDGRHGGHLEILQTSPPKPCPIELKLDGRHHRDIEIQNC